MRQQTLNDLIAKGDSARDSNNFAAAAELYAQVLAVDCNNAAIHIQCGHMNKEAGQLELAEKHYLAALRLTPQDPDLHLQLGHFFKKRDRALDAIVFYKRAANLQAHWDEPISEIVNLRATVPTAALLIDAFYPRPDSDSGSLDQMMYIKILQLLGYTVFFAADHELEVQSRHRTDLEAIGVRCIGHPEVASIPEFLSIHSAEIAVCLLSRVDFGAHYLETVRQTCPHARVIFNPVDLHHVREAREAELLEDRNASSRIEELKVSELNAVKFSDATIVVSETEADLIREELPGEHVLVIPLVRDYSVGRRTPFADRTSIGFIGGFYHRPNIDAVNFFLDEIWPKIRQAIPDIRFYVIGSDLPATLSQRQDAGVVWVGHVADIEPWFNRFRITVAPLRYGAGAKGKVVTSLSFGVPCILTPIAAEGMYLLDSGYDAVAESAEQFAQLAVKTYTDADIWLALSDSGLTVVRRRHSFQEGTTRFRSLLKALCLPFNQ